jgi:hypothetical protein
LKPNKIPIENFNIWWCGPFALGLIFSPPLALIAKNGKLEIPFTFSPVGKINKSERFIPIESFLSNDKGEMILSGLEWKPCLCRILHFPFNSRLSIVPKREFSGRVAECTHPKS